MNTADTPAIKAASTPEKKEKKPRNRTPKAPRSPRGLWKLGAIELERNIPRSTSRQAIVKGELPALKMGRDYYVKPEDLERFIESRRYTPTTAA